MRTLLRLLFLVVALFICLSPTSRADSPVVDVMTIKGTINPVLIDYVRRSVAQAEAENAAALVIQLDTPGGLDSAMRDIVQSILGSRVPVVVYVSPTGARAASAGTYITMAAHIAAMAPNTVIGAATPVQLGEGAESTSDEMKKKIINDAAAYLRDIATSRGRNVDWAEQAVREGISATSQEALEGHIVDLVAPGINELLSQIDGRQVRLSDGRAVTLQTRDAAVKKLDMSITEDFLYSIADPNIAYILLSLAMLGIIAEILNPGMIFPGVIGGISLLLAFYSLGFLPVNYAGVLLIALAFILFILELFTGAGLLAAGGVVSLVIGSLILFKGGSPVFRVNPWLIAGVTIFIVSVFVFIISRVVQAHRRQASVGKEELAGKPAMVKVALDPEGTVFLEGEYWGAVSEEGKIEPGEEVTVTRVEGLKLWVKKRKEGEK